MKGRTLFYGRALFAAGALSLFAVAVGLFGCIWLEPWAAYAKVAGTGALLYGITWFLARALVRSI